MRIGESKSRSIQPKSEAGPARGIERQGAARSEKAEKRGGPQRSRDSFSDAKGVNGADRPKRSAESRKADRAAFKENAQKGRDVAKALGNEVKNLTKGLTDHVKGLGKATKELGKELGAALHKGDTEGVQKALAKFGDTIKAALDKMGGQAKEAAAKGGAEGAAGAKGGAEGAAGAGGAEGAAGAGAAGEAGAAAGAGAAGEAGKAAGDAAAAAKDDPFDKAIGDFAKKLGEALKKGDAKGAEGAFGELQKALEGLAGKKAEGAKPAEGAAGAAPAEGAAGAAPAAGADAAKPAEGADAAKPEDPKKGIADFLKNLGEVAGKIQKLGDEVKNLLGSLFGGAKS